MVPELSVVIPMYHEEEVLPLLVGRLRPLLDAMDTTYEVVAVDDGSKDLTAALLPRSHREWPALLALTPPRSRAPRRGPPPPRPLLPPALEDPDNMPHLVHSRC